MAGLAEYTDIAAFLAGEPAFDPVAVTAGGGGDGLEVDGLDVDREAIQQLDATDQRRRGLSAALLIAVRTTLAAAETLTVIANAQHSATGAYSGEEEDFDHRASAQPPDIPLPSLLVGPGVLTDERDS